MIDSLQFRLSEHMPRRDKSKKCPPLLHSGTQTESNWKEDFQAENFDMSWQRTENRGKQALLREQQSASAINQTGFEKAGTL